MFPGAPPNGCLWTQSHSYKKTIVHEIDSSTVHVLVKAILFHKINFICIRAVSRLVNRYLWFFQILTKSVVNQSLNVTYSYIRQLLYSYVKKQMWRKQFFIHFRRTQEFNFSVMLKVPHFVFRFLENFVRQLNLHAMTKYCQRLLNVVVGKRYYLLGSFSHPSLYLVTKMNP